MIITALQIFLASLAFAAQVQVPTSSLWREGDVIFHKSKSSQSAAIAEAQGSSPWTHMGILLKIPADSKNWRVLEAVQPVRLIRAEDFIARGRERAFEVKRWAPPYDTVVAQGLTQLKTTLFAYLGRDYDLFFEWSDQKLYCSELVYKGYAAAFSELPPIATLQKLGDLRLTGPKMRQLIRRRSQASGHPPNLEEPILTPAQLMASPLLITIDRKNRQQN